MFPHRLSHCGLLLLLSVSLFTSGCRKETAGRGVRAPDFALSDLNGQTVRLSELRGKVVILNFWASWCPPCRKEMPDFAALYRGYRDKGLEIVGITLSSPLEDIKTIVEGLNIPYMIILGDEQIVNYYAGLKDLPTVEFGESEVTLHPGGIEYIPTTFVIDRSGKIYRKYEGPRERGVFEKDITTLL
jgi:cytochrome c biogenesis protein CcmG/thiol:disulfide interchange protein DsbE